jgi:hypothetical protein
VGFDLSFQVRCAVALIFLALSVALFRRLAAVAAKERMA